MSINFFFLAAHSLLTRVDEVAMRSGLGSSFVLLASMAAAAALLYAGPAGAGPKVEKPISVQFINQAQDIPGIWDDTVRSEFTQAMAIEANNVAAAWRKGRLVLVSSDLRSRKRLIAVDHPLFIGGQKVGGYHEVDSVGPYAIFDVTSAYDEEGAAGPFLYGSHELAEMLADPSARRYINGWYAEIVDPVVCCHYDVILSDGSSQSISDFVLPNWFWPRKSGPYDYADSQFITSSLEVGPGGWKQRK